MIYQLKAKADKDYVFGEESSTNFLCYTELVNESNTLMGKLPEYLNPDKYHWNLYVTDCCLAEKFGLSYSVAGLTDFKKQSIYINSTIEGVFMALPHEIGHMVDTILGISETAEWKCIFDDFKRKYGKSDLFQRLGLVKESLNAREFFAEVFRVFVSDKYWDLYSRKDYIYYDDRTYFKELYCYIRRCIDLLFFKDSLNVLFYEKQLLHKEYYTKFDDIW